MTPEVKQRIEQIRQGIVPEGYKKTKTDIVPVDWKESPIGEYICEYTEKTTIPNQYPVLTSARTGLMLQTDYYSNRQVTTEDNVGYNVLPYGYVTFRSRSDDGRFRFNENRIIERGIISYFYPVFSFSEKVCHEYMLYLLNFSIYRRMYPYAEGTAQQVLSLKKLGQLKYSFPPVAEQKKIAEILATQDKAIELQGRKIEELKRFKQGCLEKMFPRKGQKVPEKRFPGFTGDWEQRKFSEFTFSAGEKNRNGLPLEPYAITNEQGFIAQREAHNDFGYMQDVDRSMYLIVKPNSFAYNPARINVGSLGYYEGTKNVIVSSLYEVFQTTDDVEDMFLNQWFRTRFFSDWIEKLQEGSVRQYFYYDKLCECKIYIPSVEEQQQIGAFFKNFDNLITLHQRKLEEMKKQKKALMQLLLTGIVRV